MRFCKKCVINSLRPGITFDERGICSACHHYENRKSIDWNGRWQELVDLCKKYKRNDNYYDCIIAVSGGKDSHFQVDVIKNKLGMNPLLVNVSNFDWTDTGRHNFNNINEVFGCDVISLHLNRKVAKKLLWKCLVKYGSPTWYWDRAVYVYPIRIAVNFSIPLVVYGENVAYEYGGVQEKETYSARKQVDNDVARHINWDELLDDNIAMKDLNSVVYPSKDEIERTSIDPVYLSYFLPWDGKENYEIAKEFGFLSLNDTEEWDRQGYIEQYDQIDSRGYLVHPWIKFLKFGHARATDVSSSLIRSDRMARNNAVRWVIREDYKLDPESLKAFLDFVGHTEKEFWEVVDKWANKEILDKRRGVWRLKPQVMKALKEGGEVK